ncbi:type VI secretion system baseplate subunit TssE [Methylobacterium komagatae]
MRSLFERLEAARGPGAAVPSEPSLAESVLASIRQILNARQGCCQTRRDLGLPDLTAIAQESSETVPAIERAVKAQIERFEPRLRQVSVRPSFEPDNVGSLTFAISAIPVSGSRRDAVSFDALIDQDGQVHLR